MEIQLIAAVDKNWGIGFQGGLLFYSRYDMAHFKEKTIGHAVIMGRKTMESLPDGNPLPGRLNIVLTRSKRESLEKKGIYTVSGIDECIELLKRMHIEIAFVIGGESVYQNFLKKASSACITKIDGEAQADTWFPNLDLEKDWVLEQVKDSWKENGIQFRICYYRCVKFNQGS